MKKLILLSILLIVGCDEYAPTDHTHEDEHWTCSGTICMESDSESDTDGMLCSTGESSIVHAESEIEAANKCLEGLEYYIPEDLYYTKQCNCE